MTFKIAIPKGDKKPPEMSRTSFINRNEIFGFLSCLCFIFVRVLFLFLSFFLGGGVVLWWTRLVQTCDVVFGGLWWLNFYSGLDVFAGGVAEYELLWVAPVEAGRPLQVH